MERFYPRPESRGDYRAGNRRRQPGRATVADMTDTNETERNRRRVLDGFTEFANGNVDILRTLLRVDFIEHSPGNPSGRDAFVGFIAHAPLASARLELKRVIAEHWDVVQPVPDAAEIPHGMF
jgi:predicted SnoaL-like aldol condensation-catalyzing enzyme